MSNEHVAMLNKFQPFDPDFKEIYFESANLELRIETSAFDTLKQAVGRTETRLVVLTGDAGHGKTHLCGMLIQELANFSMSEAAALLIDDGYGQQDIAECGTGRWLRVIRDLSEKRPDAGGEVIRAAHELNDRVTVVCGNEGHLRACAKAGGMEQMEALIDASVLQGHMYSADGSIVLINLNHQSVVAERNEANIFQQVVQRWVSDESQWVSCSECEFSEVCPILDNRNRLNENDGEGKKFRAEAVETLLRITEQTGSTVTIRQLLIFVAYLLTAGLRCEDVKELAKQNQGKESKSWQWEYLFHHVAFGHRLSEPQRRRLEVFSGIRRLDPGRRAIRAVDDRLSDSNEAFSGTFAPPYKAAVPGSGAPTTISDRKAQATQHLRRWRAMRRFDFFEALKTGSRSALAKPSERVGLTHIEKFYRILDPETPKKELREIRDSVVQGLEAIQGISRSTESKDMQIAHWAFSGRNTKATVVGASKKKSDIDLLSQSEAWEARNAGDDELINGHVDWIERRVVVSLEGASAPPESSIELMLHELEFVLAAATGLLSEHFYAAQFRRITNELGRIPHDQNKSDEIVVFSDHERYDFLIEDDVIRLVN